MSMLNVAMTAANGRMGQAIIQACLQDSSAQVTLSLCRTGESNSDVTNGMITVDELSQLNGLSAATQPKILIDFSLPDFCMTVLQQCTQNNIPMVTGTTGLSAHQQHQLEQASRQIPILQAANFSSGVHLSMQLMKLAAKTMQDCDIEIIETHHRHKIDSPSGTALAMGQAIADELDLDFDQVKQLSRNGIDQPRSRQTIGISAIRAGDVVGEHRVLFACEGENIEITHKASSRLAFAKGALRAAKWLQNKPAGMYGMQDVLGF